MLTKIYAAWAAVKAWWSSDTLASKTVRIPLKLSIVGTLAVIALGVGLYGAGKVSAYMGEARPATSAQLTEFRSQLLAAVGECKAPAKVEPVKKTVSKKR